MNIFIASGNIGKDYDLRYTANQKPIGSFSLPVKSGWGDNKKTSWVNVKVLGKKAEGLQPYLAKGMKVTVSGEFVLEEWEKDGIKHSRPVIVMNDIELPQKQQSTQPQQQRPQQAPQQTQTWGNQPPQRPQPQQQGAYNANQQGMPQQQPQPPQAGNFQDFDDDIPF